MAGYCIAKDTLDTLHLWKIDLSYEVVYRLKHGKKMHTAYIGSEQDVYEQVVKKLEQREDMRYLSKSVTQTDVTLFD